MATLGGTQRNKFNSQAIPQQQPAIGRQRASLSTSSNGIYLHADVLISQYSVRFHAAIPLTAGRRITIQYKICKAPCCRGFRGAGEQDSYEA